MPGEVRLAKWIRAVLERRVRHIPRNEALQIAVHFAFHSNIRAVLGDHVTAERVGTPDHEGLLFKDQSPLGLSHALTACILGECVYLHTNY